MSKRHSFMICLALTAAVAFVGFTRWRMKKEISKRRKRKKEGSVNIGGIFGMDIGGTLSKIVYFEKRPSAKGKDDENGSVNQPPLSRDKSFDHFDTPAHQAALEQIYQAMQSQQLLGQTGRRDQALGFYSSILGGRFHFIRFETRMLETAIQHLSATDVTQDIKSIGCTGGGAHKYSQCIHDHLDIDVLKFDELQCLIRGMHFILMNYPSECYTYRYDEDASDQDKVWQRDAKDYVHKVQIPYHVLTATDPFPYLVVNIGSGVSIMKVTGPGQFERVSGTSIGGGTYWGLCRLFTRCTTFEEVLDMAESGDNSEVDMLVRDIYGSNYDQMNLKGSMVASSFGKLVMAENPHEGLQEEDLAIALLMMITNNIGQVAYLNAQLHSCRKIFFVGNFMRHNNISCRRLAFAISFWSKQTMEALFLEHEGYFGAMGSFLESAFGDKVDDILASSHGLSDGGKDEGSALRFVELGRRRTRSVEAEGGSPSRYHATDEKPRGTASPHSYTHTPSMGSPRSRLGGRQRTTSLDSANISAMLDSDNVIMGLEGAGEDHVKSSDGR
mmetsp:Transcript_2743/g.4124  ORF Transcript_2743/g.4124 Transcript_2743/m.4124 type:complete len:556 (+) Transcript_2743:157-1824(+)|eukprot:CAMPEP_0185020748 /NCGR_PEP_ID=MMETSP1103-20130426/3388_1 /TAXON_ID=36769 /ORGANISM="Paraphysomonas bandaiensis, Strain Caron Lab Isolate" /LENGTH=555 /DNA_ID=CAMNT_0027551839 /DNA_START=85 /DNA_END=1752 /DNA_ORIENTATION=+